jgi:hypothetical protein
LIEGASRDKTRAVLRRLWVCCAIGLWATVSSCGGLAADGLAAEGLEPERSGPSVSQPADPPEIVRPRRETCEDNPLLAECPQPYDACRENPQSSACSSAPEPDSPDVEGPFVIAAAQNVLSSYCGACHGAALTELQASASINYIDDWNRLLETGLIERCSPRRSRIVVVMRSGEMPPAGSSLPPVSDADIGVVEDAIDFDCSGG